MGHGSEFVVRLPTVPSQAAVPQPLPAVASARSLRMLIVDDNIDTVQSAAILQGLHGHQVRTAFTGAAAIALAREFLPEVVLLDIGLPGMDGYEVARKLREIPELDGAFLVAMTGYGTDKDKARSIAAGFDQHMVKPADPELLRVWLEKRSGGDDPRGINSLLHHPRGQQPGTGDSTHSARVDL